MTYEPDDEGDMPAEVAYTTDGWAAFDMCGDRVTACYETPEEAWNEAELLGYDPFYRDYPLAEPDYSDPPF